MNGTMLQGFSWYLDADGGHWRRLAEDAQLFADNGITAVWLPPAYKGMAGANDVGYGVYDTYDLGEFDQKGSVRTKYGTREEYLAAIDAIHAAGMQAVADVVLDHRMGADGTERVRATEVALVQPRAARLGAARHHGLDALRLSRARRQVLCLQVELDLLSRRGLRRDNACERHLPF